MFVARLGNNRHWETPSRLENVPLSTWPLFYRWHYNHDDLYNEMIEPLNPDQIYLHAVQDTRTVSISGSTDDQLGLIEMRFKTPVTFIENDILGLLQLQSASESSIDTQAPTVKVLRQRNGYGLTLLCTPVNDRCTYPMATQLPDRAINQQMPHIAIIETGKCIHIADLGEITYEVRKKLYYANYFPGI